MNIKYDNELTEFELQAELYTLLKGLGFNVKGEVSANAYIWGSFYLRARLDIVVFNKHNIATHIIEVKTEQAIYNDKHKIQEQIDRYKNLFHLPVILCYNVNQFTDIINTLSK